MLLFKSAGREPGRAAPIGFLPRAEPASRRPGWQLRKNSHPAFVAQAPRGPRSAGPAPWQRPPSPPVWWRLRCGRWPRMCCGRRCVSDEQRDQCRRTRHSPAWTCVAWPAHPVHARLGSAALRAGLRQGPPVAVLPPSVPGSLPQAPLCAVAACGGNLARCNLSRAGRRVLHSSASAQPMRSIAVATAALAGVVNMCLAAPAAPAPEQLHVSPRPGARSATRPRAKNVLAGLWPRPFPAAGAPSPASFAARAPSRVRRCTLRRTTRRTACTRSCGSTRRRLPW